MRRIIFHDPRLSSTSGGGESLTLRKIVALDRKEFSVTILTQKSKISPLFAEFQHQYPYIDIVSLDVPHDPDRERFKQFVHQHGGTNLWGKDKLIDDAIRFNEYAAKFYHDADYDLVSFSMLMDLFGLDIQTNVAFHIYGSPPADMAEDEAPLLSKVNHISAVSSYIRDVFLSTMPEGLVSSQVEILPPGIPEVFFESRKTRRRDVHFLFAGRLVSRKGVDLIFHALKILRENQGLQPIVVIAGDGEMKIILQKLCEQLDIAQQVKFVGTLNQSQLIGLIDRSQWFLYPVRKPEAFGISPLEAMARGVPSIVGTLGGMADYFQPLSNGYAMAKPDAATLSELMRRACQYELPRDELVRQCLKTAQHYSGETFSVSVNKFFTAAVG